MRSLERQLGADGQVRRVSALRKAEPRLPATGRERTLAAGSGLELDGLQLQQADAVLGEVVTLRLGGSAESLVTDIGGHRESLKPSLLEYAARHHGLGLLWSAAGLSIGISNALSMSMAQQRAEAPSRVG